MPLENDSPLFKAYVQALRRALVPRGRLPDPIMEKLLARPPLVIKAVPAFDREL